MASVHAGFSLSIISGSGLFFIAFYLRFAGSRRLITRTVAPDLVKTRACMKAVPNIMAKIADCH